MLDQLLDAQPPPVDTRIGIVSALLIQSREFSGDGAPSLLSPEDLAELLKLSGDLWTTALLAELTDAKRRALKIVAATPFERVVASLVGQARSRDASVRFMRRAVSRPIWTAMLQAQDLLTRIQADKMPLTAEASDYLDEQLQGLQQAWTLYSDRLWHAFMGLRQLAEPVPRAKLLLRKI